MIKRPSDIIPREMVRELERLSMLPEPISVEVCEYPYYRVRFNVDTWLEDVSPTGVDRMGAAAFIDWVRGPKIARVTEDIYQALSRVEVRLELREVRLPYRTVLVELPPGKMHRAVIVHRLADDICVCHSLSVDHRTDICTVFRQVDGHHVEESLAKFDDSIDANESGPTLESLRVAVNMLLAMANFGCQARAVFPAEAASDRHLAGERSERGARARERLCRSPQEVEIAREVKLYRREGGGPGDGPATGGEKCCHWRRGHWHRVAHGPGRELRRLAFYAPVLVREDRLVGPAPGANYSVPSNR